MSKSKIIFVIAGEPSGDARGAELVQALRQQNPDFSFEGLGGEKMASAGVRLLFPIASNAVLGVGDVIRQYFKIRKVFYTTLAYVKTLRPAAVILIDFPGFNLRFAQKIKRQFPVFYYISPQIWAWGGRRIRAIRRFVNRMIVFFRFEEKLYNRAGVPVTWVGHPIMKSEPLYKTKGDLRKELGVTNGRKIIALLPGSRETEIKRILPTLLKTALKIQAKNQKTMFVLPQTDHIAPGLYDRIVRPFQDRLHLKRFNRRYNDLLQISDFAIVTSGTATLETAISLIPFVIVYRTAASTYFFAKRLIQIPYIGLVNVVAGRRLIKEFIQGDARPKRIAAEVNFLLDHDAACRQMVRELENVRARLGPAGAAERAAKTILTETIGK